MSDLQRGRIGTPGTRPLPGFDGVQAPPPPTSAPGVTSPVQLPQTTSKGGASAAQTPPAPGSFTAAARFLLSASASTASPQPPQPLPGVSKLSTAVRDHPGSSSENGNPFWSTKLSVSNTHQWQPNDALLEDDEGSGRDSVPLLSCMPSH